jgi:hypothetical protein
MRIIPNLADATNAISNAFLGMRFTIITLAIALVLAIVFTLCC